MSLQQKTFKKIKRLKSHKNPKHQQGVVIVVALFVVALVAAIAYFMMARLTRDTERTDLILRDAQATHLVSGSVAWAKDQLSQHIEKQKKDKLVDVFPIKTQAEEVDGFVVQNEIFDMQARFNLNEVKHPVEMDAFEHLILLADPKQNREDAQKVVVALSHWLMQKRMRNQQDEYYAQLPEPYQAAHRPLSVVSEMRLLQGVDQALYLALSPYVATLPQGQAINIQTATGPVIMSLHRGISPDLIKEILVIRARKPFVKVEDFLSLPQLKSHNIDINAQKITVLSQYFLLKTTIVMEEQSWVIYTLLLRQVKDKTAQVMVLWQSRNIES